MGGTREVAERFFERFGSGDIAGAMACFAPECLSLTPAGPVEPARPRWRSPQGDEPRAAVALADAQARALGAILDSDS
jgi:hypothetical protein